MCRMFCEAGRTLPLPVRAQLLQIARGECSLHERGLVHAEQFPLPVLDEVVARLHMIAHVEQ